jgi:hypothetical protein
MAIGDTVQAGLMRVDSSPIQVAGAAQARANEAFGNALRQAAQEYFIGKEKKERAKEIEEELIRQGANPDSAKAVSKNPFLQKERARTEEAAQRMQIAKMQVAAQRAEGGANRAQKAAEMEAQQKKEQIATDFKQKLLSEAVDPAVQANFEQAQPGLFSLGGDPTRRNQFLEAQRDQQPKVIAGELGSSDFARFAQDNQLDPDLAYNRFVNLEAQERATAKENLGKLGDQFASKVGSLSPYYFSESDAANAINQQASKLNIALTKDQLDLALKKQKVIDPQKINELATKQIKESRMDEAVDILQAGKDLKAFLEDGSPLSANVAKEKLARMIQPRGILTEEDLRRVGGSKGLRDRIDAAIEEMLTGKADDKTMQYLRDTAEIFERSASDKIKFEQPEVVSFLSRSFGITPEDTLKFTTLGKFQKYLPALPSNQSENTNTQNPSDPASIQTIDLDSGGKFTPTR